jgi:hypothetical protein
MKQEDPGATVAIAALKLMGLVLFIGVVILVLLVPPVGRALRAFTVAGNVLVAKLLRRITHGWPAAEAITTRPTACILALILWSFVGVLIAAVPALLLASLMWLLIGGFTGMLTGLLCSLLKEPSPPRRPQVLEDIFPGEQS